MPIRTDISARGTGQPVGAADAAAPGRPTGSIPGLDRQLARARQSLARGDIPASDAARLRSLLTLAGRALSRGDLATAQRYADDAEQASGAGSAEGGSPPSGTGQPPGEREGGSGPGDGKQSDTQKLGRGERRVYHDVSSDSGVSFKEPTPLTEGQAEVMVRFHERQHLRRDTQEAEAEGRRVVHAYTTISYRTDPATGERYIKGGKTVIRTVPDPPPRIDTRA